VQDGGLTEEGAFPVARCACGMRCGRCRSGGEKGDVEGAGLQRWKCGGCRMQGAGYKVQRRRCGSLMGTGFFYSVTRTNQRPAISWERNKNGGYFSALQNSCEKQVAVLALEGSSWLSTNCSTTLELTIVTIGDSERGRKSERERNE